MGCFDVSLNPKHHHECYINKMDNYRIIYFCCFCFSENTQHLLACQYTDAVLTCPEGTHIRVLDAFFGRRDPLKCTNGNPETTCDNYIEETFVTVNDLCNGRTDCTLRAEGNPPFHDPCHQTSKYLEVNFTCEGTMMTSSCGTFSGLMALCEEKVTGDRWISLTKDQ